MIRLDETELDISDNRSGATNLAYAVIVRAILDYIQPPKANERFYSDIVVGENGKKHRVYIDAYKDAERFLTGKGLVLWCGFVGLDAEDLRNRVFAIKRAEVPVPGLLLSWLKNPTGRWRRN